MKRYKYTLTYGATVLELTGSPIGWNEKTITFSRSRYNTILRSYTAALKFTFGAKDLILTAYNAAGVNALIEIDVELLDKSDFTYGDFYSGILDLTRLKIARDWCECPIIDNDKVAKFMARNDIDVDVTDDTDLDGGTCTLDPDDLIKIIRIPNTDIIATASYQGAGISYDEEDVFSTTFNPFVNAYRVNEIGDSQANIPDIDYVVFDNTSDVTAYIIVDIAFNIAGSWNIVTTSGTTGSIIKRVIVYNNDVAIKTLTELIIYAPKDEITNFDLDADYTAKLTVLAGHKLKIKGVITNTMSFDFISELEFNITDIDFDLIEYIQKYNYPTTYTAPIIYPYEVLHRLLEKTTGAAVTLDADMIARTDSNPDAVLVDGTFSLIGCASGAMIRNLNEQLKTNVNDFFKAINAITPVGLWYDSVNDEWQLKAIENYYKATVIITLGEVSNFERSVDEQYYYNEVKGGYPAVSYEEASGIKSFHVPVNFSLPIKTIKNTYDIVSNYRADDYGIQFALLKSKSISSEDMRSDNDIFFICTKRGSPNFVALEGVDNFEMVSGFYNVDSRKNLDITPKRNLIRHGKVINSGLWKEATKKAVFQSSQYGQDITTKKAGVTAVTEISDNTFTDAAVFIPEIYNFASALTEAHIQALLADPHGLVIFPSNGVYYMGFIEEASTEPFNRTGNWTLKQAPYLFTVDANGDYIKDALGNFVIVPI